MLVTFWVLLFSQVIFFRSIECKKSRALEVKFLSISTIPNPLFLEYCDVGITPGSHGRAFDLKTNLVTNITKDLHIGLAFFMRSKQETEYKQFFSYDFDMCRLMDGFMSQTVARLWSQNLKKFSNFPINCPITQGELYIRKMKIDRKSIPMLAVNGIYMAKVVLYIKNITPKTIVANTTLEAEVNL